MRELNVCLNQLLMLPPHNLILEIKYAAKKSDGIKFIYQLVLELRTVLENDGAIILSRFCRATQEEIQNSLDGLIKDLRLQEEALTKLLSYGKDVTFVVGSSPQSEPENFAALLLRVSEFLRAEVAVIEEKKLKHVEAVKAAEDILSRVLDTMPASVPEEGVRVDDVIVLQAGPARPVEQVSDRPREELASVTVAPHAVILPPSRGLTSEQEEFLERVSAVLSAPQADSGFTFTAEQITKVKEYLSSCLINHERDVITIGRKIRDLLGIGAAGILWFSSSGLKEIIATLSSPPTMGGPA